MTLADDVNVEEYIMAKDDLSGADIKAICTEAGLMALRYFLLIYFPANSLREHSNISTFSSHRERRMKVTDEDFKKSKENVLYRKQEGTPEGLYL